jgi:type III secretion protein V
MMKQLTIRTSDLTIALLLVAIISLMIVPLPTFLIDSLLAVNISISLLLLMVTMYMPSAVALSSFPSILLFTTLFRLSLNIASTKAILLHADAGHVIESFGQLVVGGNLVVGIVVFLIVTIVQFIVITKGSERVAEVGARFTLDAMPGKQMSIDADLRAGLLKPNEARAKRNLLAMESQLHGGMDGAMKFVKGDSIAGLVITVVNIVAGVIVGITYHEMTAAEAANRFAVLSIGDAMVSQIPSLLICVAAGIMITRVADEQNHDATNSVGQEIMTQLGRNASALYMAGALVLGFAFIPGFPWMQFIFLSAALITGGILLTRKRLKIVTHSGASLSALKRTGASGADPTIGRHAPALAQPLALRLSPQLEKYLDIAALNAAFNAERIQVQETLGLPFPGLGIWYSDGLEEGCYDILVHDVPSAEGQIRPGHLLLALADPRFTHLCLESGPAGGEDATFWLPANERAQAEEAVLLTPEAVLARHAVAVMQRKAHRFVGIQEVQWMMESLMPEFPGLVGELQKVMPLQRIGEVLRRLLEEQISIRNMRTICESLTVWGAKEKDTLLLCEHVRGDLGQYLAHRATQGSSKLSAIFIDASVEQLIRQSIKQTPAGNYLALPPDTAAFLVRQIADIAGDKPNGPTAIVSSMDVRRYIRRLIEEKLHWLDVYSFQELGGLVELRPIGKVTA